MGSHVVFEQKYLRKTLSTQLWSDFACLFFSPAQVQHIVTETRDKIMQYKSKMADEADLRRRLASLEESVELHEHMKRQVALCCRAKPRGGFV